VSERFNGGYAASNRVVTIVVIYGRVLQISQNANFREVAKLVEKLLNVL